MLYSDDPDEMLQVIDLLRFSCMLCTLYVSRFLFFTLFFCICGSFIVVTLVSFLMHSVGGFSCGCQTWVVETLVATSICFLFITGLTTKSFIFFLFKQDFHLDGLQFILDLNKFT